MELKFFAPIICMIFIVSCSFCAKHRGAKVETLVREFDCSHQLLQYDKCMNAMYGRDQYKMDDFVGRIFRDNKDWEICYEGQNCALPETLIPLEDVTVDNGAHTINVDETLKAAATCALPLLKRYLSPVLAKCVRSQLGRGYAWSVPMTSIESLTQEVEWYKDYKPLIEEGFLSSLFEEEAKIREGYQNQLMLINQRCPTVTVEQLNHVQLCLMDRAHELVSSNSEQINSAQNLSAKCNADRNATRHRLVECHQKVDWNTIWPKIKRSYFGCIKRTPSLAFLKISSTVPFGQNATITVDENLFHYLINATRGVTEKLSEVLANPDHAKNVIDECSKENVFVLGKNYDERLYDVVDIQSSDTLMIIKKSSTRTSRQINIDSDNQTKVEHLQQNAGELYSSVLKSYARQKREPPSCAEVTKACYGLVSSKRLPELLAEKFGATRRSSPPLHGENQCIEGRWCETGLLVQLIARPFIRYFEVIQAFTPTYNSMSKWGMQEKAIPFK